MDTHEPCVCGHQYEQHEDCAGKCAVIRYGVETGFQYITCGCLVYRPNRPVQARMRCECQPEEILKGHREDCPLNHELAPKPLPPPMKPFEEMGREEMIVAHTALRATIAVYVKEFHKVQKDLYELQQKHGLKLEDPDHGSSPKA